MDYTELAKKLYPPKENDEFPWYVSDYDPIIYHFGKVIIQVDDDNYSGDSRVLYYDEVKGFGYLQFGWGSCTGCDALQACQTYDEIGSLIKELEPTIKWDTKENMLKYFKEHDWKGDYYDIDGNQQKFVNQVIEYLENENANPTSV